MGLRIRFLFLALAAFILLGACGQGEGTDASSGRRVAPDFALRNLEGGILRLEDLRGKVVLVNFFATWCAPCRQEIPDFVRLRKKFLDQGFEIVGISLDMEGPAVLNPLVRHFNISYPVVIGTREVVTDYGGIDGVPTTFFIDREGFIAERVIGLVPESRLEQMVENLL